MAKSVINLFNIYLIFLIYNILYLIYNILYFIEKMNIYCNNFYDECSPELIFDDETGKILVCPVDYLTSDWEGNYLAELDGNYLSNLPVKNLCSKYDTFDGENCAFCLKIRDKNFIFRYGYIRNNFFLKLMFILTNKF